MKQKFGIWGQQLWLFANGLWNEPLLLEVKDRTTISSSTTLPYDEHDYEAALTFTLSEATRLTGQLRREQLQLRELGLTIRFNDFSELGGGHRFQHPHRLRQAWRVLGCHQLRAIHVRAQGCLSPGKIRDSAPPAGHFC